MANDWPHREWVKLCDEASIAINRPWRIGKSLKRWYQECGLVDVHEEVFKLPTNPWPKDPHLKQIGRMAEVSLLNGLQGFSMALFHRVLGWTREEIEVSTSPSIEKFQTCRDRRLI